MSRLLYILLSFGILGLALMIMAAYGVPLWAGWGVLIFATISQLLFARGYGLL